eukprot:CAMPEP_0180226420 /NCGR_PEP_ID=MMETSP0987-20121128/23432_1 /TAXON_ID=697907 /ORGANISM="non described non described, Strain CCMP2293" /LENGTH=136 /DNA_ID=CAMNT_0022189969 /DNA_START=63 /DNA_END=470 /DNA_ORIENTATION=+
MRPMELERCTEVMASLDMTGSERVRVSASSLLRENASSNVAIGFEEGSSSAPAFDGFVFRQAIPGSKVLAHKKGLSSGVNPEVSVDVRVDTSSAGGNPEVMLCSRDVLPLSWAVSGAGAVRSPASRARRTASGRAP